MNSIEFVDGQTNVDHLLTHFFEVAEFQRQYVWSDDDVNKFLDDIWKGFSLDRPDMTQDYFIGSIVLVSGESKSFTIIDGQQRITTLFLALCALKTVFEKLSVDEKTVGILLRRLSDDNLDENGQAVETVRLKLGASGQPVIVAALLDRVDGITSQEETPANLVEAFKECRNFYLEKLPTKEIAQKYFRYLLDRVKILPYVTKSQKHAITVFETLNARGVGLTPIDLVKSILFKHAAEVKWEELQDEWALFRGILDGTKEEHKRFLRYYILAEHGESTPEDEVYDWIKNNSKKVGIDSDPFAFLKDLVEFARSYLAIVEGRDGNGRPNHNISNLRKLAGRARQHYPFLITLKKFKSKTANPCYAACESILVAYAIQRMYTGDIEKIFTEWAVSARDCDDAGLADYYANTILPKIESVGAPAFLKLKTLDEQSIPRKKLKYLLCRIDSYLQKIANPDSNQFDEIESYKGFDLEHLIPQNDGKNNEKLAKTIAMLGNLTILEKTINRKVKKKKYSEKKASYGVSNYILTKGLVAAIDAGNSKGAKAYRKVARFEKWAADTVPVRQDNLCDLVSEIYQWKNPLGGASRIA